MKLERSIWSRAVRRPRFIHLPRVVPGTFHPTLTTTALYRSSSAWFEDLLLKADPEGPTLIFYAAFTTRVLSHIRLLPCFCSTHLVPLSPQSRSKAVDRIPLCQAYPGAPYYTVEVLAPGE
jgi:hypothetical protein